MSVLWRKISGQVYLYIVLRRETDSYKDSPASFELCACGCKDKQNSWIWQVFFQFLASDFTNIAVCAVRIKIKHRIMTAMEFSVTVVTVVTVIFHRFAP